MFQRKSQNIKYFLSLVPGKRRFGVYRFLPVFFCIGGVMEWVMINVRIGRETFCKYSNLWLTLSALSNQRTLLKHHCMWMYVQQQYCCFAKRAQTLVRALALYVSVLTHIQVVHYSGGNSGIVLHISGLLMEMHCVWMHRRECAYGLPM